MNDLLSQYLRDFNHEYLSTPADRRQFGATLVEALILVALIIGVGLLLLMLSE